MTSSVKAQRLFAASIALSIALSVGLSIAYLRFDSELALAHGADSVADVFTASGLWLALRISARPADAGHPFGHHGAQPVAALIVAVLTSLLAVGVAREAIAALLGSEPAQLGWGLTAAIAGKALVKSIIAVSAGRLLKQQANPAVDAFRVDARNDVMVGLVSLGGLAAAHFGGLGTLDAWLALPIALLIGWSGIDLAIESIQLLMGSAVPTKRHQQLIEVARAVGGVADVVQLHAMHHGNGIQVWLAIEVAPTLAVSAACDIRKAVEAAVRDEDDVVSVFAQLNATSS